MEEVESTSVGFPMKPTLAQLLLKSMDGDEVDEPTSDNWKLHDDDEGSSAG